MYHDRLVSLRRPKLLIRAARISADAYDRNRDLRRLLGGAHIPAPDRAMTRLLELEAELEAERRENAAGYSPTRHVEVLAAVIGEMRGCGGAGPAAPASRPQTAARGAPPQTKASGISPLRRAT